MPIRITTKQTLKMSSNLKNILQRGRSVDADETQKQDYLSLFHQSELEFDLKNQLLEELEQSTQATENKEYFDEQFEKIWSNREFKISVEPKRTRIQTQILRWAAILVIGLILGSYLNSGKKNPSPVYYTSVAPKGSISEMLLPDGSHIFLNSGSTIKYSVDGLDGIREVFLTGEAWFQVAKMKEKPFVVHTCEYDVKVTGTIFNVKAYKEDKEVITTLEEGGVQVKSSTDLHHFEEKILIPGEQLVYNKEQKNIQVSTVKTKLYTSWKENKLVFVNMSLKDLKTLLERKYGVEIQIADPSILDYHYDGIIKNETILEVLNLLKHTLPIDYEIVGQNIIIKKI